MKGLSSKPNADDLAVGDVHRDFEAKTHFGVLRLGPHIFLQEFRFSFRDIPDLAALPAC